MLKLHPFLISTTNPQTRHLGRSTVNVLLHIDLGLHNFMVDCNDPTIITGVIDWEGACIVPLWSILPLLLKEIQSRTPDNKLEELKEIRSLMNHALLAAVPEWAKLVADGRAARTLLSRAGVSEADPKDAFDYFFCLMTSDIS